MRDVSRLMFENYRVMPSSSLVGRRHSLLVSDTRFAIAVQSNAVQFK